MALSILNRNHGTKKQSGSPSTSISLVHEVFTRFTCQQKYELWHKVWFSVSFFSGLPSWLWIKTACALQNLDQRLGTSKFIDFKNYPLPQDLRKKTKKQNHPTQQPNLAEFSPNRFTPPNRPWPLQSTPPFLRSSVAASVGPAVERHRWPWRTHRRSRRVDGSAGAGTVSATDPWKLQKVGVKSPIKAL